MAQFQEINEIKVGHVTTDIIIHKLNTHQLLELMSFIDKHNLTYTFDAEDEDAFDGDSYVHIYDMMRDLVDMNDSLPVYMKTLVENTVSWFEDYNEELVEKAENMNYFVK